MKLILFVLPAILPAVVLAAQPAQDATDNTERVSAGANMPEKPASVSDVAIYGGNDSLAISKKKCLAVDKHGFCAKWDSD
ncbi:hypothetical protein [Paraburkholderia tagetis]|uniref:Uncharacterized protein n=1 Tax=Paraburkholderia tagetis TaxID=2913261 RepID=A0A9X1UEY9_9BURK|nr:hypothetical protein [Paraburkholderia tagetis]MCG5074109.1 hypothetical protein [Paraburkholderia tagetis]